MIPPNNDVSGKRLIGGEVDRVRVSLRVRGDDLDPDEITRRLGVVPSFAARRGEVRRSEGAAVHQGTGVWSLDIGRSDEWVLEDLIAAALDKVPAPPTTWLDIGTKYHTDVFCGLFLADWNRGTELSNKIIARLAERGLSLSLDVYCNAREGDES